MFKVPGKLFKGLFIQRENRFVCLVKFEDNIIRAHLPNPGRLTLILHEEKTEILLRKAPAGSNRKTEASIVAAILEDEVINLDTTIFSDFLQYEIRKCNELVAEYAFVQSEITIGQHRFDFLLKDSNEEEVITEIKSTTRVIDRIACFPDAVSTRATSHLKALLSLQEKGKNTLVIFIIYRAAQKFKPCKNIDPTFSAAFRAALASAYREEKDDFYEMFLQLDQEINIV